MKKTLFVGTILILINAIVTFTKDVAVINYQLDEGEARGKKMLDDLFGEDEDDFADADHAFDTAPRD